MLELSKTTPEAAKTTTTVATRVPSASLGEWRRHPDGAHHPYRAADAATYGRGAHDHPCRRAPAHRGCIQGKHTGRRWEKVTPWGA